MEGLALTGAWVDKEKGLLSHHRARDGRLARASARRCKPGEPVVLMGPTGTPTEIPRRRDGAARRRRPRQRGALLDRAGAQGRRLQGPLLRRLQEKRRRLQAGRDRGRHRPGDLVASTPASRDRAAPPAGPRASAATSCRRCSPTRRASSASADGAAVERATASSPSARDRMMARGEGGAARRARSRYLKPEPRGHRLASTRRCSA